MSPLTLCCWPAGPEGGLISWFDKAYKDDNKEMLKNKHKQGLHRMEAHSLGDGRSVRA